MLLLPQWLVSAVPPLSGLHLRGHKPYCPSGIWPHLILGTLLPLLMLPLLMLLPLLPPPTPLLAADAVAADAAAVAGVGFTDLGTGHPGTDSSSFSSAVLLTWRDEFYERLRNHLRTTAAALGCWCGQCGAPALVAFSGKRM